MQPDIIDQLKNSCENLRSASISGLMSVKNQLGWAWQPGGPNSIFQVHNSVLPVLRALPSQLANLEFTVALPVEFFSKLPRKVQSSYLWDCDWEAWHENLAHCVELETLVIRLRQMNGQYLVIPERSRLRDTIMDAFRMRWGSIVEVR